MKKHTFLVWISIVTLMLLLVSCGAGGGVGGSTDNDSSNATLTAISLTPTNPSIAKGTSQQLTATGTYSDNTTKDITAFVNWSSSDPSIATVSNIGQASAITTGSTTIVAKDITSGITSSTTLMVTAFKDGGRLKSARAYHSSILLKDGKVLITGGYDGNGDALKSAEIYDPVSHVSIEVSNMTTPRASHQGVLLQNGDVLLIGGLSALEGFTTNLFELFDATSQTFKAVATGEIPIKSGVAATLLSDGRVMISGGEWDSGPYSTVTNDISIYDPATQTISSVNYMAEYRKDHAAVLLPTGKVLICGGDGWGTSEYIKSCELYDPQAGTSQIIGQMQYERTKLTGTLIDNKYVILIGGRFWKASIGHNVAVAGVEQYDISTNEITLVGSMDKGRYWHSATYLPDYGKIYITGGYDASYNYCNEMESFDVTNNVVQKVTDTTSVPIGASVLRLSDSQFMVSGGYNADNSKADGVKIFAP